MKNIIVICLLILLNAYAIQNDRGNSDTDLKAAKLSPQNKEELISIIKQGIPLDRIDTSKITDMSELFWDIAKKNEFFKGIETWDTSNVTNMNRMFAYQTNFNQDISSWNVAKVKDMRGMFIGTHSFNQNLNVWAVSEDCKVGNMFEDSKLIPKTNGYWSEDRPPSLQEILKIPQWYLRNSNDERITRIFIRDFLLPKLEAKESLDEMQQAILAKYLEINKQVALNAADFRIIQKINEFQKVPNFASYEQGFKDLRDYYITKHFDNKDFINTYFEILEVCDFGKNDVNDFCAAHDHGGLYLLTLSLKKPLKLRGTLVFERWYVDDYDLESETSLQPSLLNEYLGERHINALDKSLSQLTLPNEVQKGLGKYEVEVWLEVANGQGKILKNFSGDTTNAQIAYGPYSYGNHMLSAKNVQFISKPKLTFYSKREYMDRNGYTYLNLNTQDAYVNIRQSPNGKVVQKLFTKDKNNIFLISPASLDEIKTIQWIEVLYFPPNANDTKKAIIGYIHKSQVEFEQWLTDFE